MKWSHVLNVIAEACEKNPEERPVRLVLPDASFHVKEPLDREDPAEGGLLGFMVYADDPELSTRTDATRLVFVAPSQILRVVVRGTEPESASGFGFQ